MTEQNDATKAQIRAADPAYSTWVSANAGSGKTRVLTDRVARLLLHRVPPQKILCLTYTKAAASHMQNKLFERLGSWAMLPDDALTKMLAELGESGEALEAASLRRARTLFAAALETPGGLKIQTIHSFCAALLRRFPLEAGVSPNFKEMDERAGKKLRADILESLADGADVAAFDAMARYLSGDDPDKLLQELARNAQAFATKPTDAEIWASFDLAANFSAADAPRLPFCGGEKELFARVIPVLRRFTSTMQTLADGLEAINVNAPTSDDLERLFAALLLKTGENAGLPKYASVPTKKAGEALGELLVEFHQFMGRVGVAKASLMALGAAQKTSALHQFARAFLPEYERRKLQQGWLDFDDLIFRARALLTDSTMAQWVLFKLDGGIDHILVDEAQDTSPAQWSVIARLAEEFSTGETAREVDRTLFVVGDEKQSIYSFQGADPAEFDRMRSHFARHLAAVNKPLNSSELKYSFRSSSAILRMVDVVINSAGHANLSFEVEHNAFYPDLPGRVDLWPFREKSETAEKPAWFDPVDMLQPDDPVQILAAEIADGIKLILESGEHLPTKEGSRAIIAGDFLILVQQRSELFHTIIKELKDHSLPVAGADRLKIGGELAVRDLSALLSFMATPEDDLSLAAALRSPLFRLEEGELFTLAQGRKGYLWQSLRARQQQFGEAFDMLNDMLNHADFHRPYELLERILTHHRGREYLIARLGAEAEDGIDALLTQALQYEQSEAPSLTGFLGWMASDESDIKRQMDTNATEIRVMTVHGAKGLESPIVILPDTAKRRAPTTPDVLMAEDGLAVWTTKKPDAPAGMRALMEARQEFQQQERMRVLYVAMTRAESWLIICGAGNKGECGQSWYSIAEGGLETTGAAPCDFHGREILRFEQHDWHQAQASNADLPEKTQVDLPDWAFDNAPAVSAPRQLLSPSELGGSKIVEGANEGLSEEAAKRRGRQIHALLEHLPGAKPQDRARLAMEVLAAGSDPVQMPDEMGDLLGEVALILDDPALAFLFAFETLAEVPVCATLGDARIFGFIDRLVITSDHVLAVDFKTNAAVPENVAQTPEGVLRQMGAYGAALAQIYPNRQIETAILWTKTAQLSRLPQKLVTDALARAALP
ncbi:MAG: double-strand break repair helicase AddA [Alphaproteobacteria bacterium]|nr:double-strand break repair helicase AddA [Alphaproteobacteria bacterium]